jgi:hypothetical protein
MDRWMNKGSAFAQKIVKKRVKSRVSMRCRSLSDDSLSLATYSSSNPSTGLTTMNDVWRTSVMNLMTLAVSFAALT